eukprot:g60365.t1
MRCLAFLVQSRLSYRYFMGREMSSSTKKGRELQSIVQTKWKKMVERFEGERIRERGKEENGEDRVMEEYEEQELWEEGEEGEEHQEPDWTEVPDLAEPPHEPTTQNQLHEVWEEPGTDNREQSARLFAAHAEDESQSRDSGSKLQQDPWDAEEAKWRKLAQLYKEYQQEMKSMGKGLGGNRVRAYNLLIREADISEHFSKGGGKGGQKVNKTNNCVVLKHIPTGTYIKCHKHRSLSANRKEARRLLQERLDELVMGAESRKAKQQQRIQRRKAKSAQRRRKKERELAKGHGATTGNLFHVEENRATWRVAGLAYHLRGGCERGSVCSRERPIVHNLRNTCLAGCDFYCCTFLFLALSVIGVIGAWLLLPDFSGAMAAAQSWRAVHPGFVLV